MTPFPQAGLARLADRVVAGEVVFFVGAGFSIDSEGNSADRLIGRLLARFDAMTALLKHDPARALRKGLMGTFSLAGKLTTQENVKKLAKEYYSTNDWMVSAFSELLGVIKAKVTNQRRFLTDLGNSERSLFEPLVEQWAKVETSPKSPPLSRIDPKELTRLLDLPAAERGKVLFLETMGFSDEAVMAGLPSDPDLAKVERSFGPRLRPRHHVLAYLAREGLTPTLLTTNFDLLLEGAYRLAGLLPHLPEGDRLVPTQGTPPATFDAVRLVTSATDFFGRGNHHRSANLLKIHGCAKSYRRARPQKEWCEAYLPSMVFTFREIQNWRDDSWSRDLLSTLLRTRTVVFCGYSGADPVLHDTIRTVYEEMARRRGKRAERAGAKVEEAPAFFLGDDSKTEFHGMEILRAASRAIGYGSPKLANHPNYLRFHFPPQDGEASFPLLDESMRWLFHLVYRRRQAQALKSHLGWVASILLGHPCPEAERKAVVDEFEALCKAEEAEARTWSDNDHRVRVERTLGWVERFQVPLLRELALGEALSRSAGPGLKLDRLRRSPWYYPVLDHADWAAWGVVVELALRRRIAAWREENRLKGVDWTKVDWTNDQPWTSPAAGSHPAVLFSQGEDHPTPDCLAVRLHSPGDRAKAAVRGACRRQHEWELDYGAIPWRRQKKDRTPGALELWQWAHLPLQEIAGKKDAEDEDEFEKYFWPRGNSLDSAGHGPHGTQPGTASARGARGPRQGRR